MNIKLATLSVLFVLTSLSAFAQQQGAKPDLYAKGQRAPAQNFTGTVWVNMLVGPQDGVNSTMGSVTFEPGARTAWHTHSAGQVLLVTDGTGLYQEKGKPVQTIGRGAVVVCKPDIQHWHGASPASAMTHVAVVPDAGQPGGTVWLHKVTDQEYTSGNEK